MKKLISFICVFLAAQLVIAQTCGTSCQTGTSGGVTFATGYGWTQPDGTTCGRDWLASHSGTQIHYADAVGGGGAVVVVDNGTCAVSDIAC